MPRSLISRRGLLLSSVAAVACSPRKSTPYHAYCFVANHGSKTVAAVDLEHFQVRRQIALDAAPTTVIAHPKGQPMVYVLAPDAGTVYEIPSGTLAVSRRIKAGNQAISMHMTPTGDAVWVLYRDPAQLVEIPLKSLQPRRRIALHSAPDNFEVTWGEAPDPYAAICTRQERTITLVSLRDGGQRTIAAGVEPSLVTFRKDGKQVLVGSRADRSLAVLDFASGKTVVRLPLPVQPRYFQRNDDGWLFITGDGADAVVFVFPFSTEVWQTVLAGHAPGSMAMAEQPGYLLVTNPDANNITVLDINTQKLVAMIGVGAGPCQVLTTGGTRPDERFVLVLNEKSGDMAVVRMLALTESQLASKPRFKSASLLTMIPVGEGPVSADVVAL